MQNKKGFTIIELIVVIAIIAILAAIVMVNVTQYIKKSKGAAVMADMKGIPLIITEQIADGTLPIDGICSGVDITKITNAIANNGYSMGSPKGGCYVSGWSSCYGSSTPNPWCAYACNTSDNSDCYCTDSFGLIVHGSSDYFSASCFSGEGAQGCDCTR